MSLVHYLMLHCYIYYMAYHITGHRFLLLLKPNFYASNFNHGKASNATQGCS